MKQEFPDFVEQADYEKGFAKHYNEKIKPALGKVEEIRKKKKKQFHKRILIAIPVGILLSLGIVALLINDLGGDALQIPFLIVVALGAWVYIPVRKYRSKVKEIVLPKICEFYGNLTFNEKGKISRDVVVQSEIFPRFTSFHSEDYIEGDYEGVLIKMQELTLKTRSGKRAQTVFKGLFFIAKFNKNFEGTTYILKDRGKFGNWAQKKKGMERVALEDPHFEELFEVYSSNQIEARFILTTAFMERLTELLNLNFGGKKVWGVKCVFIHNKMFIAINQGTNLFEAKSINKSILDVDDIHLFLAQLNSLFSVVHTLKLNKRIGL